VASGIGGGSADAAATLRVLNSFWGAGLDDAALSRLGQSLGADVPVCLFGRTALVRGTGEIVVPGPVLPNVGLLLVNPGVAVPTATVFSARQGPYSPCAALPASFPNPAALAEFLAQCGNDLLAPACRLAPQIETVLADMARLPRCLFASLSGSGATCFGLFPDVAAARAAEKSLQRQRGGWWSRAGTFLAATPPPSEQP